jgi:nitrogen fixation-related uncharacterized protein
MALLVLLIVFLAVAVAALLWGADSREPHNNWNRF